jgi:ABC-type dipeptide/oligopeptide/nickel transport system permease component
MGRYLIRRFVWGAVTLWGIATSAFFLLRLFPGGPFDEELALRPEIKAGLEKFYGLSDPLFDQYLGFLRACASGEFGVSLYFSDQSVGSLIRSGGEATLALNLSGFLAAVLLGFALGTAPHLWPSAGSLLRSTGKVGLALPSLFFAPLLLWLLCFRWNLFPLRVDETAVSLVLPVFLLAFRPACGLARTLDLRLAETKSQAYARTHLAVGASERRLIWRWLLRGSLPPFVQQLPALGANLLSGSLLIELLFSVHGLGFHFTQSLLNRDWPLALGLTLVFGALLVVLQVAADLAMMLLDPRVKVQ